MERSNNWSSLSREVEVTSARAIKNGALNPHDRHIPVEVRESRDAPKDLRMQSLRVLALSVLREIEVLDCEPACSRASNLDFNAEVRRFEAGLLRSALIQTGGRQRRAAVLLGMKVATLNRKIKRYRIAIGEPAQECAQPIGSSQFGKKNGGSNEID